MHGGKNDKLHGFYRKLLNGKKDHCLLENDINYDRVCIQREMDMNYFRNIYMRAGRESERIKCQDGE